MARPDAQRHPGPAGQPADRLALGDAGGYELEEAGMGDGDVGPTRERGARLVEDPDREARRADRHELRNRMLDPSPEIRDPGGSRAKEGRVVVDLRIVGPDDQALEVVDVGVEAPLPAPGDGFAGDRRIERPVAEELARSGRPARGISRISPPCVPITGSVRPRVIANWTAERVIRPVTSETRRPRCIARRIVATVRS